MNAMKTTPLQRIVRSKFSLFASVLVGVVLVLSLALRDGTEAGATGIPTSDPLYYSGLLTDTSGKPLSSVTTLAVELWTAQTSGTKVCSASYSAPSLTLGRFRVALASGCASAIQQSADLWVDVVVDGASLGRVKVGAVPYAVEPKDSAKWDTAYGWGGHSKAGYLKSGGETDPKFSTSAAGSITSTQTANWDSARGWGDHGKAGYLKSVSETDPVFGLSAAAGITTAKTSNWDAAYGWGDHSKANYLTSYLETDPAVKCTT